VKSCTTSRERVMAALNHKEPDKVPLDLGGTICTSITRVANNRLKEYLNIESGEETATNALMDTVVPCERILKMFEIDFRSVRMRPPSSLKGEGQAFGVSTQTRGDSLLDELGTRWQKADYDYAPVEFPLANATLSDLKRYSWLDPYDPDRIKGLREEAKNLYHDTEYCIVADIMCGGPFEQALWLRGFQQFLMDLYINKKFAQVLLDKITEVDMQLWNVYLNAVGDYVQVVAQGDDVGMQTGTFMAPEIYKKFVHPCHKKLFEFIKSRTNAKLFYHSCGSVYALIPYFIEEGVDVLNPVQRGATNMHITKLKREFGKDIVFWGGGIDVQQVLPYTTPLEIEKEIKKTMEIIAPGGGFIFAGTHNIQPDVPPENVYAMYQAAKKYRSY